MLNSRHTAGSTKLLAARVLMSPPVAAALAAVHRHKIVNNGVRFDTSDPAFTRRIEAQMFLGLYEKAEIGMTRHFLPGAKTVLELGSSLGVNTAHILDVMDPDGHLVCVEANPTLIPTLEATIARHRRRQKVEVLSLAVSSTPVRIDIRSSLGSRISDVGVDVETATLGELVSRQGLTDYTLVCDIEGAETDFILGDPSGLDTCRLVLAELDDTTHGGRAISADDTYDALTRLGYETLAQHGAVVAMRR